MRQGFTLIEMTMILVVIGAIMSIAISAWMSMTESRRLSAAKAVLEASQNCLLRYCMHSQSVPSQAYFSSSCNTKDPWSSSIIYETSAGSQRIDASSDSLGTFSMVLRDTDGDHQGVVMVIISLGPNGQADYNRTGSLIDFTQGDDIYSFVTKNQLYQISSNS